MNILVLCTGNSARSILLESILNRLGHPYGIKAYSAGSQPAGRVHPQSQTLLGELGYPLEGLRSKSWDEFAAPDAPRMDAVITVCASAAGETCPYWPGAPVTAHWGIDDPAKAPETEWDIAFRHAYTRLMARAQAFVALDPTTLSREVLKGELTRIGTIG